MKCSLVSLILLKRSLVFPILLFSSISLHWLLRKAFLIWLILSSWCCLTCSSNFSSPLTRGLIRFSLSLIILTKISYNSAFLVAQLVKNPPAMQETWVGSLDWEDPLEKEKATHSNILAWRIPWTVRSMGSQRIRHDWATFTSLHLELLCTQGKIHIKKCLCLTRVSKQTHSLQSKLSRPRYWICFLPRVSTVSHV